METTRICMQDCDRTMLCYDSRISTISHIHPFGLGALQMPNYIRLTMFREYFVNLPNYSHSNKTTNPKSNNLKMQFSTIIYLLTAAAAVSAAPSFDLLQARQVRTVRADFYAGGGCENNPVEDMVFVQNPAGQNGCVNTGITQAHQSVKFSGSQTTCVRKFSFSFWKPLPSNIKGRTRS